MKLIRLALLALVLFAPPALADEKDDLFAALKAAKTEAVARAAEDAIWRMWVVGPTPEATEQVALAMQRRGGYDFAGALEILNETVAENPDWAEAWNQRAFVLFLQEKYDESLEDIDRTLELEPRHFGALAGKGRILMLQGRTELGQKALREAVALHPFLRERSMILEVPGKDL